MLNSPIDEYAHHCQYRRAAHEIDDKPDFKMFVVDGTAYLQPLNARARDFICGFDVNYRPWQPIRLTAYDLDTLTAYVKEGKIKISIENIDNV